MGEVAVGDLLYDADGRPTRGRRRDRRHGATGPATRSRFSDGSTIVADAEHQWLTETRAARKSKWAADNHYNRARNQRMLRFGRDHRADRGHASAWASEQRANHAVLNARAARGGRRGRCSSTPTSWAPGSATGTAPSNRITCETDEIPMYIEGRGYECSLGTHALLASGCPSTTRSMPPWTVPDCGGPVLRRLPLRQRATPSTVLHRAPAQAAVCSATSTSRPPTCGRREAARRELLAGLHGHRRHRRAAASAAVQFAVTNERLARRRLRARRQPGLPLRPHAPSGSRGAARRSSTCYILNFSTTDDVFQLERKQLLHKEERPPVDRPGSAGATSPP